MKKAFLSAVAIVLALALPGAPATAQTNEITIGITLTTTGPGAALGIPERNALEFVAKEIGGVPLKVIVLDDGGDPTNATTNARRFVTEFEGRHHHGLVDHAADDCGVQRRQRGRHSPYRPVAVPDHAGAHEMVGVDAAADPDHGQGAVPAHEGA